MSKTTKEKTRRKAVLSFKELVIFSEEMKMMISGGISSLEGITILLEESEQTIEKEQLQALKERMEETGSFAQAIEGTGNFPSYYCQMIKIGEQTGKTEEVLQALSEYYQREYALLHMMKSAVSYPIFMGTIMVLILYVIITKVLPIFSQVYQQLGSNMTGISAGLLTVGAWLNKYPAILPLLLLFCLIGLWFLLGANQGRKITRKFAYHIKSIQEIVDLLAVGKFSAGMALMLESGMGLSEAIEAARQLTIGSLNVRGKVNQCQSTLENQCDVGAAIALVYGGSYGKMVLVAEKAGQLEQTMSKLAEVYQMEAEEKIQGVISIIEPSLVILISILVGVILLSVMLPLLGIMTGLQ